MLEISINLQVYLLTKFFFQPFRASGKQEPYVKRCANTRVQSSEKLMYICKNQLGIHGHYIYGMMMYRVFFYRSVLKNDYVPDYIVNPIKKVLFVRIS